MSIDNEEFIQGYITAALWSTTNQDLSDPGTGSGPNLDEDYGTEDLSSDMLTHVTEECEAFIEANEELLEQYMESLSFDSSQAGHDFWLTRNGHGAGFWDRASSGHEAYDVCQELTEVSKAYGEENWFIIDDHVTCDEAFTQTPTLSEHGDLTDSPSLDSVFETEGRDFRDDEGPF